MLFHTPYSKYFLTLLWVGSFATLAFAQSIDKKNPPRATATPTVKPRLTINRAPWQFSAATDERALQMKQLDPQYEQRGSLNLLPKGISSLSADEHGLPTFVTGTLPKATPAATVAEGVFSYLTGLHKAMRIAQPTEEWRIKSTHTDEQGIAHTRLQQWYQGIPVWNSEIMVHSRQHIGTGFNGHYVPTPQTLRTVTPTLQATDAEGIVKAAKGITTLSAEPVTGMTQPRLRSELCIYTKGHTPFLAWHVTILPDVRSRWEYFVEAHTGEVLHYFKNSCQLHNHTEAAGHTHHCALENAEHTASEMVADGPAVANAIDLKGISRTINTYQVASTYYLLDGSRPMFNLGASQLPDNPAGGILTLNANNQTVENFNATHITSSNNTWNNPTAVSAHYNAGVAYAYFKNTFNRNSIDGQGGSIYSVINIREEAGVDMDNAFWNGEAMFYGNGDQAFNFPLARALDVAGHEMSHGVVQGTANLTYQGESGALNESFADIFGVMIDRDDWTLGEDVVNPSVFPSGALRSMQDPHNGGSSINSLGWQPKHYNERYIGTLDNGGVHINSGIPNYAFYLVATATSKEKAEQIFYRALRDFLTASSNFVDMRNAVVQAATAIHGANSAEVTACNNAFNSVGIGSGQSGNYQQTVQPNPGQEFILLTDSGTNLLYISNADGTNPQQISQTPALSRPSITDDGRTIVFIGENKLMYYISINWSTGDLQEDFLSEEPIWRNVVISKDGNRVAALTDELTNTIFVADFSTGQTNTRDYTLYNPTTSNGGINTNNVEYADALEFDLSGQYILYDAYSTLGATGYWDINIIRVWNNSTQNFSAGTIFKVFNALPDNVNVGNPTYAKNAPHIIAFDYIEGNEYAVLGVNVETGDVGEIYINNDLGYPSYGILDSKVGFTTLSSAGTPTFAQRNVTATRITGTGNPAGLVGEVKWGTFFGNGTRNVVSAPTLAAQALRLSVQPNPTAKEAVITFALSNSEVVSLQLYTFAGQLLSTQTFAGSAGKNIHTLPMQHLPTGTYIAKLQTTQGAAAIKIIKN